MSTQVTREQKMFQEEFGKWADLTSKNAPLKERIEQARLDEYISNAVKILPSLHKISDDTD